MLASRALVCSFLGVLPWIADIRFLTFDCYGTLIDWETGILSAVQAFLSPRRASLSPQDILELYVSNEARLEASGWKPYRTILKEILGAIAHEARLNPTETELEALPASVGLWPPFADTVSALQALKKRFQLAVVSNIDDALFAQTAVRLETRFDHLITAEQVRSYKPRTQHFQEALHRLQVAPGKILHVAQSLYHDHVPASQMGFRTAWVNRPSLLKNTGLAPAAAVKTDLQVTSLAELADLLLAK